MDDNGKYLNLILGENNISGNQRQMYIVKLDPPAVSIRFNYIDSIYTDFDSFYKQIADVQFICNDRPDDPEEVERILIDAWNFFVLEERKLDEDIDGLSDMDNEM